MMTRSEFIARLKQTGADEAELENELGDFDEIARAASEADAAMPGIGFFSVANRMNCFMSVCRHLDSMVADGRINPSDTQFVLMVLRFKNKKFLKAITMFDVRGRRYGPAARADMPQTAREYLAGLEMYG
jgi:hypothetical protein